MQIKYFFLSAIWTWASNLHWISYCFSPFFTENYFLLCPKTTLVQVNHNSDFKDAKTLPIPLRITAEASDKSLSCLIILT